MTTEAFCTAEGVSKPSFYAWRRKLGLATPRPNNSARRKTFQQVIVTSGHAALTARLPGGIEIEVSGENALRAVVSELMRAGRVHESESAAC